MSSGVLSPHPTWSHLGAHESPVPAGWWLCPSCVCPLRCRSRLAGAQPSLPCSPQPPMVALGTGCPLLAAEGRMLETSGCAPWPFLGSRDFIPGTPLLGWGGGCRSPLLLPLFLHPFIPPHAPFSPPTLPVGAPGCLGCCPAPQLSAPHQPGLNACCPLRHLLGFAPMEDLSLRTSAWPRFGCRSLPVPCSAAVIPCSSRCCCFLSLQLVG